jgi:hypothetical protein
MEMLTSINNCIVPGSLTEDLHMGRLKKVEFEYIYVNKDDR